MKQYAEMLMRQAKELEKAVLMNEMYQARLDNLNKKLRERKDNEYK